MLDPSVKILCICSCLCAITTTFSTTVDAHSGVSLDLPARRTINERRLSFTFETKIEDTTNLALDLNDIVASLVLSNAEAAEKTYIQGGHSYSRAILSLPNGLTNNVDMGSTVTGSDIGGSTVNGLVVEDVLAGFEDKKIKVDYVTGGCHVGGLGAPTTDGCFEDSTDGNKTVYIGNEALAISYNYEALQNTTASLSLQKISNLSARNNPSKVYEFYLNHSDVTNYADDMITAALNGAETNFQDSTKNFDFAGINTEMRTAAVRSSITGIAIWSAVISKMQDAVSNCDDDSVAIVLWEQAAALFLGNDPSSAGYFISSLVMEECKFYGTCPTQEPTLTKKIMNLFSDGKVKLRSSTCQEASVTVEEIQSLMYIPLVQLLLRMAYEIDVHSNANPYYQGFAAGMAASLGPALHSCDSTVADTVINYLKPGKATTAQYAPIRLAIESTYACLNITCADVGGLKSIDLNRNYYAGAKPCVVAGQIPADDDSLNNDDVYSEDEFSSDKPGTGYTGKNRNKSKSSEDGNDGRDKNLTGIAVGATIGTLVFVSAMIVLVRMHNKPKQYVTDPEEVTGQVSDLDLDAKNEGNFVGEKEIV